jgi:hypothetical protein
MNRMLALSKLKIKIAILGLILSLCTAGCAPITHITSLGSQPMDVPQAPEGMTYWEFMADRIDAAKTVKPARCGWGMFLSLATLGPIYSIVYTDVAIHPDGFLAKVTAPDAAIPKGMADAKWSEVWWIMVERLSWRMLAGQQYGCRLRAIMRLDPNDI